MTTRPADKAAVLSFLQIQSPTVNVQEVTAANESQLRAGVYPNLLVGQVVWMLRSPTAPIPGNLIGVLWSNSPAPLIEVSILQRPAIHQGPSWISLRHGHAVVDDHDHVWMRLTPDVGLASIVRP